MPPALELPAVADARQQCRGGGLAHAGQPHEPLRPRVLPRHQANVAVVLGNALVQVPHFAEEVADDRVGPARQVLQRGSGLAAHGGGLQRQHDAELAEQAADAVERGGALLDVALAGAVNAQLALLGLALGRHEAHGRTLQRLADRRGVGSVVLAARAAHAVRGDELWRDAPHRVAQRREQPRPVVRARAGFHADGARRQSGDQLVQPGAPALKAAQVALNSA